MEKHVVFLVALVCTCLVLSLLLVQWRHIHSLRVELMDLELRVRELQRGQDRGQEEGQEGFCCSSHTCCGLWLNPAFVSSREKRNALAPRKPRQKRQKQRSFLHLVPALTQSYDERDLTVLTWALGRSQGAGLQVSGETINVTREGLYFIYSQVLYSDTTWVMGHVITKRLEGAETKLMKCLKSMPSNVSLPLNTCYTAGVHFLESGSLLELSVPRKSAELILSAHATFFGIFSL
ncbi:tumor necrosis factor ligand superfamily member 13 isoform X2 [Hoplias malabaricus]|uniref:tumor necrosis factor ligand superfamily member 13 isoform X2 n=1 Tax=Hoplias malabaricus TaxID=27720 RepID=UPI003462732C